MCFVNLVERVRTGGCEVGTCCGGEEAVVEGWGWCVGGGRVDWFGRHVVGLIAADVARGGGENDEGAQAVFGKLQDVGCELEGAGFGRLRGDECGYVSGFWRGGQAACW